MISLSHRTIFEKIEIYENLCQNCTFNLYLRVSDRSGIFGLDLHHQSTRNSISPRSRIPTCSRIRLHDCRVAVQGARINFGRTPGRRQLVTAHRHALRNQQRHQSHRPPPSATRRLAAS